MLFLFFLIYSFTSVFLFLFFSLPFLFFRVFVFVLFIYFLFCFLDSLCNSYDLLFVYLWFSHFLCLLPFSSFISFHFFLFVHVIFFVFVFIVFDFFLASFHFYCFIYSSSSDIDFPTFFSYFHLPPLFILFFFSLSLPWFFYDFSFYLTSLFIYPFSCHSSFHANIT